MKNDNNIIGVTFSTNTYLASARAGGDWHAEWYEPDAPDYVTYVRTTQPNNKSSVDNALRNGYTVASAAGGLAYMTMTKQGSTYYIGD